MSRIEQALQQAGLRDAVSTSSDHEDVLRDFSATFEPEEVAEEPAEPDVEISRAAEPQAVEKMSGSEHESYREKLVVDANITPVSVEQYRRLAAVLHHMQGERGTKVVMVASAQAGEGKTLTAANLSLTLSESYRRDVLLIDADLRGPTLELLFQARYGVGLNDSLRAGPTAPLDGMRLSRYLSLLPGGTPDPDPMAGLTSRRMGEVIAQAASKFDWVILDTPPVALLSDAHLLAAMVEAVVLVISAGSTPLSLVQRAVETLGRDRIVGVVLNRVEDGLAPHDRYYAYRGYPATRGRRQSRWRRWLRKPTRARHRDWPSAAEVGAGTDQR
jgi:capsular exopolysaccharide synthesis family protein